jgi:hypothetical protein
MSADDEVAPAKKRPSVNVFGAGISGLTVAHELAERGFRVRVIERDTCLDRGGRRRIAVGGVARTQYAVAREARPGAPLSMSPSNPEGMNAVAEARDRGLVPIHVPFAPRSHEAPRSETGADVDRRLSALLAFLRDRGVDHRLSVTGYTGDHDDAIPSGSGPVPLTNLEECLALALSRARTASAMIAKLHGGAAVSIAAARPGERPPDRSDGVTPSHDRWAVVDVSFTVLPGEHGFRFFPSYYNHVFDTMRRIPILDAVGDESSRTVYDNVVPTPSQGIVTGGVSPLVMPRSPPGSDYERSERLAMLRTLGYTAADVVQLMLRVTRYMSTCSARRAREMERISWWEYLEGHDPDTGQKLYEYSERFQSDAKTQSRVLASFDAVWGDARTCGNTYVQLLYNWLRTLPKVDGTMNAPTSESWLEPWRAYLERRLGVEFVPGELSQLTLEDGKLVAHGAYVRPITGEALEEDGALAPAARRLVEAIRDADYHVVATDACTAEAVTLPLREAGVAVGITKDLGGFTTTVRRAPPDEGPGAPRPPAGAGLSFGVSPWDRMQTMSGLQIFFGHELKINDGYVFYSTAPWGLTSINSAQFWARRPTLERDGFVSLLSIDLCDWNTKAREGAAAGKAASECTPPEIADQVYAQIVRALGSGKDTASDLPAPVWFHFDETIEFGADGRFARAKVPYLVPIKADFHNRPGPPPWDPSPSVASPPPPEQEPEPGVWRAPHGGYLVHWDRLVFAGVYLKTFTRMSTMEAANESGRHAANAILDHQRSTSGPPPPPVPVPVPAPASGPSHETRYMGSEVFFRSSPAGDYCAIWDMEHGELPDFAEAKQRDAWCLAHGLPHPWDLLGIERLPSLVSRLRAPPGAGAPPPLDLSALDGVLEAYVRMAYPGGGGEAVLEMLRGIRKAIEGAGPPGPQAG